MASRGDIKIVEVQPQLFKNWAKTELSEALVKPGTFTKLKSKEYLAEGLFPVVDQGEKLIAGYVNDKELIYQGEIPVVIFGDHTRNIKYIDFEFAVGADGTKILKPKQEIEIRFFFYYLKSLNIPSLGYSRHFQIIKNIKVPLPPLAEQKRIVAKLDAAFQHLETIKAKLERIPELLKNFRQAVLTQAVTGKLTKSIRSLKSYSVAGQKLEIPSEWQVLKFSEIIYNGPQNGMYKPQNAYGSGKLILRIDNFYGGKINGWNTLRRLKISEQEVKLYGLNENDIVINRVNSIQYLGKSAIIENLNEDCVFESNIMRIELDLRTSNPKYIIYYLNSIYGLLELRKNAKHAVNQASINQQDVKSSLIILPSLEEQEEIVSKVASLLAKADAIEAQYQTLKEKIDKLPQALLAKAFKGELVPQDPNDEPASVLLERIKEDKATVASTKVAKGKKVKAEVSVKG